MSETSFPSHFSSHGSSPFWTSWPMRLQRIRRKYSCRGNDRKLLESVNMPIKQLSNPIFDKVLSCFSIPSFWSRYHQPEPNCTLPFTDPSLKLPIIVAKTSLSLGFKL